MSDCVLVLVSCDPGLAPFTTQMAYKTPKKDMSLPSKKAAAKGLPYASRGVLLLSISIPAPTKWDITFTHALFSSEGHYPSHFRMYSLENVSFNITFQTMVREVSNQIGLKMELVMDKQILLVSTACVLCLLGLVQ